MARKSRQMSKKKRMSLSRKRIVRASRKRQNSGGVYTFKGTQRILSVVRTLGHNITNPAILGGQLTFAANGIDNWPMLSELFDVYRLKSVTVKLMPQSTGFENQAVYDSVSQQMRLSTANVGQLLTAVDRTGNSGYSGSIAQIMQYENVRVTKGNDMQVIKFKPKPAQEVYRSALTTAYGYTSGNNPWLDVSSGDVPHYGLLLAVTPSGVAESNYNAGSAPINLTFVEYDAYVTFEIEFKNVK